MPSPPPPPVPVPRGHIKIPNVFLIHRAITCDSFKVLVKKAWEELGDK